jgi:hypothetical protein
MIEKFKNTYPGEFKQIMRVKERDKIISLYIKNSFKIWAGY